MTNCYNTKLKTDEERIHVALITFSRNAYWMNNQKEFLYNQTKINATLNDYAGIYHREPYGKYNTTMDRNMIGALEFVDRQVLRWPYPNTVMIFLTDGIAEIEGKKQVHDDIVIAAYNLRNKGVKIYSIGVGSKVNDEDLIAISSDPPTKFYKNVADFDALNQTGKDIGGQICKPNWALLTWIQNSIPVALIAIPVAITVLLLVLKFCLNRRRRVYTNLGPLALRSSALVGTLIRVLARAPASQVIKPIEAAQPVAAKASKNNNSSGLVASSNTSLVSQKLLSEQSVSAPRNHDLAVLTQTRPLTPTPRRPAPPPPPPPTSVSTNNDIGGIPPPPPPPPPKPPVPSVTDSVSRTIPLTQSILDEWESEWAD